jgi:hypothetical protein
LVHHQIQRMAWPFPHGASVARPAGQPAGQLQLLALALLKDNSMAQNWRGDAAPGWNDLVFAVWPCSVPPLVAVYFPAYWPDWPRR